MTFFVGLGFGVGFFLVTVLPALYCISGCKVGQVWTKILFCNTLEVTIAENYIVCVRIEIFMNRRLTGKTGLW